MLDWYAFNLSKLPEHDLEATTVIFGAARSGKSTLLLWLVIRYFQYKYPNATEVEIRGYVIDFILNSITYSSEQNVNPFKNKTETPIAFDEAYFAFDKRNAMQSTNVDLTKYLNAFASNRNPVFILIQQLSDLEKRVTSKSFDILVYERGVAFLNTLPKNAPIMKTEMFERVIKNPWMLRNKMLSKHSLTHLPEYSGTMNWIPFENPDRRITDHVTGLDGLDYPINQNLRLIYETYIAQKKRWQESV